MFPYYMVIEDKGSQIDNKTTSFFLAKYTHRIPKNA